MKTKHILSKAIKKLCATLLALVIFLSLFACAPRQVQPTTPTDGGSGVTPSMPVEPEDPPLWSTTYTLPDGDAAMQKLINIYGGADKVFLLQNGRIARMPCPQGEVISLNMRYEVSDYVKLILEDCVAEFNEVFAVINPNYSFAINYSPTDEDFSKKYSVRMSIANDLESSDAREVFGFANISYYNNFTELGDFAITIRSDVFENGSYLMTTFKHELMHLLGAGDAYKNNNATKDTIMQSYTVSGYKHFSATDVMFLDTLYRNPACPYTDEQIAEYFESYEAATTHTQDKLTAAVYKLLLQKTSAQSIVSQASAIGYADIESFVSLIERGTARDTSFGSSNIAFTELPYTVRPESTYFGRFGVPNTYWHGRQTSLGSSQGIKYTDYGDGLLYAAPNGNMYTLFIKIENYVILFDRHGSFTSLQNLELTVRNVCSVNQ